MLSSILYSCPSGGLMVLIFNPLIRWWKLEELIHVVSKGYHLVAGIQLRKAGLCYHGNWLQVLSSAGGFTKSVSHNFF